MRHAGQPVVTLPLVLVRVAAGLAMFFWASKMLSNDTFESLFLLPPMLCKYWGFEWVRPLPGDGMYWFFRGVQAAGLSLAVGLLTRISGFFLCGTIAYVLLLERTIYVNHYYLISCVCAWLALLGAGKTLAVDAWLRPRIRSSVMPAWHLWLLRFQLGLPYVFGAIAKLNMDWLSGQPAGLMVTTPSGASALWGWIGTDTAKWMVAYGGLLLDAAVVPALYYRRTRWFAVAGCLAFHAINSKMLIIGVFPWFMLAVTPVFFPAAWFRNRFAGLKGVAKNRSDRQPSEPAGPSPKPRSSASTLPKEGEEGTLDTIAQTNRGLIAFALLYVVVQLILPWRHWWMTGNPAWNDRGHRFAWRMMLRDKLSLVHFKLVDQDSGDYLYLPVDTVLTAYQTPRAGAHPECLRQAAVQLAKMAESFGIRRSRVHALALVSLNGRKPVPLVDPNVDLLTAKRGWFHDDWVRQDPGPFIAEPWTDDRESWWTTLDLPPPFEELQGRTPSELMKYLKGAGSR